MKLHVYLLPNSDGRHRELVAAPNQKEACRLIGTSTHTFRLYGGGRTDDPTLIELAMREPGRVWRQKLTIPNPPDWEMVELYEWNKPKDYTQLEQMGKQQ
jgi:hypothetical protein